MRQELADVVHLLVLVAGLLVLPDNLGALALQFVVELGLDFGQSVQVELAGQLVYVLASRLVEFLDGLQELVLDQVQVVDSLALENEMGQLFDDVLLLLA